MNIVKQKTLKVRFFAGRFEYVVVPQKRAGRRGMYDTYVLTAEDPVRIGCELALAESVKVIKRFDAEAPSGAIGNREKTMKAIMSIWWPKANEGK